MVFGQAEKAPASSPPLPEAQLSPTYAATAWYHGQIENKPADVYEFLNEVREFTENEYVPALYKGDQLSETEKIG